MPELDVVVISMTVQLWNGIDAAMDNKGNSAQWSYWEAGGGIGDPTDPDIGPVARLAGAIRAEGWRQIDQAWRRPPDEIVAVSLTAAQWQFIVAEARESLPAYEELAAAEVGPSRDEMLASAELCRMTIDVVSRTLGRR